MQNKEISQHHDHLHPDDHDHPHPHDHSQDHEPEHDHDHPHPHDHDHEHSPGTGIWGWIATVFHWHGHSHQSSQLASDQAFTDNAEGIRTIWLALAALLITSLIQIVIVLWSGSVALLADTLHNVG